MVRSSMLLVSCGVCAAVLSAQEPPPLPPRDHVPPTRAVAIAGDARVFGKVVDAATGRPLRGAFVLAVPERLADGTPLTDRRAPHSQPIATRTGDDGHFALAELAPGEYSVVARRAGYVQQQLGQASPSTPARRLMVQRGAVAGPIEFALLRSAVISGRVLDAGGAPAEGVTVGAAQMRHSDGLWRLQPVEHATTNDLGEFRVFGLPPGSYVVSAQPARAFVPPGAFAAHPARDHVPTFAPSTTSDANAQMVRVAAGQESEAHIHLVEATVANVEGRVVDSRGVPARDGFVNLQARGVVRMAPGMATQVQPDGSFTMHGVPPGAYTVATSPRVAVGTADERAAALARSEYGVLDVDVDGDVAGLVVRTQPGTRVRGRLVVDGDAAARRGREVRVHATPTNPAAAWNRQARARVMPDLTFELHGVRGPAVLRLGNAPDGWWTRAVRVGRADATDGHDFGVARVVTDVTIVVSTSPGGLRGRVVPSARVPAPDAVIIGFDEDERKWGRSIIGNAFMVRPVEDGSWSVDMLRPGSYLVVAVPAAIARGDDMSDPEYLRQLRPHARTVVVTEGQTPEIVLEVQEP